MGILKTKTVQKVEYVPQVQKVSMQFSKNDSVKGNIECKYSMYCDNIGSSITSSLMPFDGGSFLRPSNGLYGYSERYIKNLICNIKMENMIRGELVVNGISGRFFVNPIMTESQPIPDGIHRIEVESAGVTLFYLYLEFHDGYLTNIIIGELQSDRDYRIYFYYYEEVS